MIIDIHIHIAKPGKPGDESYWSGKFSSSPAFMYMVLLSGNLFSPLTAEAIENHILSIIENSQTVEKAVLLALDEVYDENGERRPELTHLYVSNSYIRKLSETHDKVLKGYSIHPHRKDFKEQLARAKEEGAFLIKLIPSSQMFDPSSEKIKGFWKTMAELSIPALCHTGPEYAIPTSDSSYNKYNDPEYLIPALDEGATIIVAHCATPYFGVFDTPYEMHYSNLVKLFNSAEKRGWKLYADISALATPFRYEYIKRILRDLPQERLLFGSDYPIPISTMGIVPPDKNPLDLYISFLKEMGFKEGVFHNASSLREMV